MNSLGASFALLLLGSFTVVSTFAKECDITKCGVPKHYRELGCEPVEYAPEDKDKCCPIKYNCDELAKQDASKCHFRGKIFNEGERMSDDKNCRTNCVCNQGTFRCAFVECPELVFERPEPHCVIQNSREKCCSEKIVCEEKEIEKLPECWLDNKKYRQGQLMYPEEDRCFTCLCDATFDNSTAPSRNTKHCAEVDCHIDLAYLPKIRSGCVPIYYGEPTCCPIAAKCPSSEDKFIPGVKRSTKAPAKGEDSKALTCKFGAHELQIGDKVSDKNKCVDCECTVPPMVTCVQKRDC